MNSTNQFTNSVSHEMMSILNYYHRFTHVDDFEKSQPRNPLHEYLIAFVLFLY